MARNDPHALPYCCDVLLSCLSFSPVFFGNIFLQSREGDEKRVRALVTSIMCCYPRVCVFVYVRVCVVREMVAVETRSPCCLGDCSLLLCCAHRVNFLTNEQEHKHKF